MPYYRKDIFKKIYHYNKLVVELPKTLNNCVRLLDRQKWTLGEGDRGIVNNITIIISDYHLLLLIYLIEVKENKKLLYTSYF